MAPEGRRVGTRRKVRWTPRLVAPLVRPRRAGPAELFAQVAPLLAGGSAGAEAMERLAELLQDDPALIDLRFDESATLHAVRSFSSGGTALLADARRAELHARALPALVPPRFGRKVADALAAVASRRADPRDRMALALGRYFAILDDVEGAAGAGANPLWQLLLELTSADARGAGLEGRELLRLPDEEPEAPALAAGIVR